MLDTHTLRITVPEGGHELEARFSAPLAGSNGSLALIAPPHPLYGGTIENPVVCALEEAFRAHGFGTLAFNFRGTGESSGVQRGDLDEASFDFLAAAAALPNYPLCFLAGYSFGSCVALRAASSASTLSAEALTLLLVAPALGLFDPALLRAFTGRLRVVVGAADEYAPHEKLRELLPDTGAPTLEVLAGADHFFLGGELVRLSAVLRRLIA